MKESVEVTTGKKKPVEKVESENLIKFINKTKENIYTSEGRVAPDGIVFLPEKEIKAIKEIKEITSD